MSLEYNLISFTDASGDSCYSTLSLRVSRIPFDPNEECEKCLYGHFKSSQADSENGLDCLSLEF